MRVPKIYILMDKSLPLTPLCWYFSEIEAVKRLKELQRQAMDVTYAEVTPGPAFDY